jgi:transcriptional regulator with XRE-family HTH domain
MALGDGMEFAVLNPLGVAGEAADRTFPELLRSHRVRAGLTQQALADLSTVSLRAIRDLEAGRARGRMRTIQLLADSLRLPGLMREVFVHAAVSGRCDGVFDTDPGSALPRPMDALIGRDPEVRAIVDVLESGRRRMISISGLPGVGKTRVAVEIAHRLNARRGWPVLWMDARSGADNGRGAAFGPLLRSLRALIDSDTGGASRVYQLVGDHEVLLVLDGFAGVRASWAVEELLAYCPGVRIVSTSRAPWHLACARTVVISPLATPAPERDKETPLVALAGVPSVRLLVDRLAEVRPGFVLAHENAGAVAEMCRRLDGLPLALELVAGRFRVMSLRQLTHMSGPDLLDMAVPGPPGTPRETIGGLLGSSCERVGAEHRAILRKLASLDRALTVADIAGVLHRPIDDVVEDLSVLIGYGLLRTSHGEQATELHMPRLLRALLLR